MGTLVTDFLLIKPGALHRANGGYLLIDARKLLLSPFAWEALKRAIKAARDPHRAAGRGAGFGLISTQIARSRAHPARRARSCCSATGSSITCWPPHDPDFARLFKVQADFDDTIARSAENDRAYARADRLRRQGAWAEALRRGRRRPPHRRGRAAGRRPREAVDRDRPHRRYRARGRLLVEPGQAQGDDARRTWRAPSRSRSSAPTVCATGRRRRSRRGIVLVDTEGAKVGQINGAVGAAARLVSRSGGRAASRPACGWGRAASPTSSARSSSAGRCIPRA